MKKLLKATSTLAVVAFAGSVLLAPVSSVSSKVATGVLVQDTAPNDHLAIPMSETIRTGLERIAIEIDTGRRDYCHRLSGQCTLRHGYGTGIYWRCMKDGGCAG